MVLVDGDMRRPMLDKYLDLVGSVGFSTVLSGRASLDEVLQKTRFPGLTVLTSGAIPPNPSELLGSLAAKKVLSELRAQFDYVIVDSSPLLAVTDAAILAADSDGVLIMARFGQTKREQLAHAVGNLEDVGAPTTRRGIHDDARTRKCVVQTTATTAMWSRPSSSSPAETRAGTASPQQGTRRPTTAAPSWAVRNSTT